MDNLWNELNSENKIGVNKNEKEKVEEDSTNVKEEEEPPKKKQKTIVSV